MTESEKTQSLLFVSNVFYPDSSATSQLFVELFQRFRSDETQRLKVTVYCGFPTAARGDETKAPRKEEVDGIQIFRCGANIDHKRSLVHRAWRYVSFLCHVGVLLICGQRFDLVLGVTNPPFIGPLLWICSRIRGFSFQYMLLDVFPEGLVALGSMSRTGLLTKFWKWLNGRVYHAATEIIVLGRDMIPLIADNYGVPRTKFHYVPHWSVVEIEAPLEFSETQLSQRLGLGEKFVVQYSGNMGLWHDINTIVRAAETLREHPEVHFLMIGGGRRREEAEELSKRLGLKNMTWHEFVPLPQLRDSLSSCHVALISLNDGLEGIAVPCKMYGILASGRAIIAQVPSKSEVALTVEENECGVVLPPGDGDALANTILQLSEDRTLVESQGRRGFEAYRGKYRVQQAKTCFEELWQLDS